MMDFSSGGLIIVSHSFSAGGAEKVAVNLANQYADEGINVSLMIVNPKGPYREMVSSKVKIIDLNATGFFRSLLRVYLELRRHRSKSVLSVIRDTNIYVGFSSYISRPDKVVFREANTYDNISSSSWWKRMIWLILLRCSYRKADFVIANSVDTRKDIIKNNVAKLGNIKVINNPVLPKNVDDLMSEEVAHDWLHSSDFKVILNVGRLHTQKNQSLLLRAFARVVKKDQKARLIILGEGRERESLIFLAKELGISNFFQIVSYRSNPFPFYKRSNLFVLSSNYEGFGNVVVEALSSGTPVISTSCSGGPKDILANGEYGVLVGVDNENEMVEAMLSLLSGAIKFDSHVLIERSKLYSIESVSQEYREVFRGIYS